MLTTTRLRYRVVDVDDGAAETAPAGDPSMPSPAADATEATAKIDVTGMNFYYGARRVLDRSR